MKAQTYSSTLSLTSALDGSDNIWLRQALVLPDTGLSRIPSVYIGMHVKSGNCVQGFVLKAEREENIGN
jgi:hypothetical protein